MNDTAILEIVIREMSAYGMGWRLDWSEFDGRTLRAQLDNLATWAILAQLTEEDIPEYLAGTNFYKSHSN